MAIITKPGVVTRNSPATFTLNKTELASISSVASDPYFTNIANWKKVKLFYMSSTSNQMETVIFDATQASPQSDFLVSDKSIGNFLIQKITIEDFDRGYHIVKRDELVTSDFDVIF
jgi:hypothetical protein